MPATPTLPSTFKALVYEAYGPLEDVLKFKEVPMAPLGATTVRVRMHCAALNPADALLVGGAVLRPLKTTPSIETPHRLGFDGAGVVVEVGDELGGKFQVGDEVFVMTPFVEMCTLAEYAMVDASWVALKPKSVDFAKAAAVPAVSLTSYQGLCEHAKLQEGERILTLGGSTAVGMYAIQHANMIGAHVIATASTTKVDFLKSLGADQVIDYTKSKWSDVLEAHSVDVIYDCGVEPASWDGDAQVVLKKEGSRFVTVLPGPPPSEPRFGAKHVVVSCYDSGEQLAEIAKFVDTGKIRPVVDSVYPFEKVVDAMKHVSSRRVLGKVVIEIQ